MNGYTFDSDDLGAGLSDEARFRLSYDALSAKYGPFILGRTDNKPFAARSEFRSFGLVKTIRTSSTAQIVGRRAAHMSGSRLPGDAFDLQLNESGSRFAEFQRGRETVLEPGGGGLFTLSEPGEIRTERDGVVDGHWYLIIPRPQLCALVPDAEARLGGALDPASPAVRHLGRYLKFLRGFDADGPGQDPAMAEHFATTILDLVALSLGAKGDWAAVAHARGLRAARMQELVDQIRTGFADPDISPEQVARKLRLSPRYLQQLLHETGSTFTERVLELRLQRARQMLVQRGNRQMKISDIAYACGFNEVSYFNRCFRRRFGDTPTGYRAGQDDDG